MMRSFEHTKTETSLEALLTPIGLRRFVRDYWQQASLYVPGGGRSLALLYDTNTLFQALAAPAPGRGPDLGLNVILNQPDGSICKENVCGGQIEELLAAGISVQIQLLEARVPHLLRLCENFADELAVPTVPCACVFLSCNRSGYAGWHYDAADVFAIQIEGEKTWHHGATSSDPCARACALPTADQRKNDFAGLFDHEPRTTRLRPGDMLYLPAGTWHRAEAHGYSAHVSISISTPTVRAMMEHAAWRHLGDEEAWRRFPSSSRQDESKEAVRTRMMTFFEQRLCEFRAAIGATSAADLADAWRRGSKREFVVLAGTGHSANEEWMDRTSRMVRDEGRRPDRVSPRSEPGARTATGDRHGE